MKCVSTWTFSWKLGMISDPSPSPPGCSQSSSKIARCRLARLAAGVYLYSPQIQTDNRPFLFRLSLARDKPEDNELGKKIKLYCWFTYLIVEQTFYVHGHSRRGEEQQRVFIFVQLCVEVAFENKEDMRTLREMEWWQRAGCEYLSLNKQDVRARDNDRCSIILRTGARAEDKLCPDQKCQFTQILTQHFLFSGT